MDLLILDLNGVLVKETLANELTKKYRPEGEKYWKQYKKGEISATEIVKKVGKTLEDIEYSKFEEMADRISPVENSKEFASEIKEKYKTAIISSDFDILPKKIANELGIKNYYGNVPMC
ncbi:MAG: HAD family hydrolase [Candidatus Aenigmatarchaeota archaeon]